MNKPKIIEKEEEIICANKHQNEPIIFFLNDKSIDFGQRLQCLICMRENRVFPSSINFLEARQIIQDSQDLLYQEFFGQTKMIRDKLEAFKQNVNKLKSQINKQLDSMIAIAENWTKNLNDLEIKKQKYSLLKELENFNEPMRNKFISQFQEIQQCNHSYFKKIQLILSSDQYIRAILTCQQILEDIFIHQQDFETVNYAIQKDLQTQFKQSCQKHNNSQIIFVDVKQSSSKVDRVKCMYCGQGDAITITEFETKWKALKALQNEQIQRKLKQRAELYQQQRKLLKQLIIDQQLCISDWLIQINQQQFFRYQQANQIDQLQEMAEEYSTDQNSEILREEKIELEQSKSNQEIFLKLKSVVNTFEEKINNLNNQSIKRENSLISRSSSIQQSIEPIDNSTRQEEFAGAIAFNKDNTQMAAGCDNSINLWKFDKGQLVGPRIQLKGHIDKIYCLAFSKEYSWLASGSRDSTIRLWKDIGNNQWQSSKPGTQHIKPIECIIMNKNENQLFSSSWDKSIKLWKIDYQSNSLQFDYSLNKHKDEIFQIALNQSETQFVSTSRDKQIIVWEMNDKNIWTFKYSIKKSVDDFGQRVCFINDETIAWLQCNQGILHIFISENGVFEERQEQAIQLCKDTSDNSSTLFPFILNREKGILVCKHNQHIYLIRNSQFQYIVCSSEFNYGGLSNDGEYLVTWNSSNKLLKIYKV